MGFLAGWVGTEVKQREVNELSSQMADCAPSQYKANIQTLTSPFGVCLAPKQYLIEFEHCMVFGYGGGLTDARLKTIAKSYLDKGDDFIHEMQGDFALAILDRKNNKLLLLIDPLGHRNLYFSETKTGVVFGTSADCVIKHPTIDSTISMQSIYDYVYFHHCPSPNTIYQNVKKLEGGQALIFKSGKLTINRYWMPSFSEKMEGTIEDASQELQEKLTSSVKKLSSTVDKTGAFLSGGLDSSSVAGALSSVFPDQANTFTIGFPVEGYDEIEFARIAGKHFNTQQHEYYLSPEDTVNAIPEIAAFYDEPFGNSSALAAYYCAKMAKDNGIKVLLAGDGGDEIFAGNERYARQLLFERYDGIPGSIKTLLNTCLNNAPDILTENKLIFKAKRYVDQAETPLPDRLQDYNFLHRHKAEEVFSTKFLSQISTESPISSLRDCYHRPKEASSLNRMLYMDWKSTLHDNDLVKVNKMCEMAGLDVHYPLLDHEIINLSLKIPSSVKLKGQNLRWFYKQAMGDFLPQEILNKSKHGFGLPFGIWLKDHPALKEMAYDSINALKKRDYFQDDFLDHAISMHQSIHASYYGELIWILMMLELWLQAKKH